VRDGNGGLREYRCEFASDNDIVLDDDTVSRHHAVIVDTGNSFVITDLRSANEVDVAGQKVRVSATMASGFAAG
jgi:SARP family transcriptional regulator, regulator of embCAB operon